jgi:hypothetical protein
MRLFREAIFISFTKNFRWADLRTGNLKEGARTLTPPGCSMWVALSLNRATRCFDTPQRRSGKAEGRFRPCIFRQKSSTNDSLRLAVENFTSQKLMPTSECFVRLVVSGSRMRLLYSSYRAVEHVFCSHLILDVDSPMTNSFAAGISWTTLHLWWFVLIACVLGIAPMCIRGLETEKARVERVRRRQEKKFRALAEKILSHGRNVHQRFPTGDAIVSEGDLAEQLRNRSDAVVTALNLLLNEQKVQRAPLNGYWKLNV